MKGLIKLGVLIGSAYGIKKYIDKEGNEELKNKVNATITDAKKALVSVASIVAEVFANTDSAKKVVEKKDEYVNMFKEKGSSLFDKIKGANNANLDYEGTYELDSIVANGREFTKDEFGLLDIRNAVLAIKDGIGTNEFTSMTDEKTTQTIKFSNEDGLKISVNDGTSVDVNFDGEIFAFTNNGMTFVYKKI